MFWKFICWIYIIQLPYFTFYNCLVKKSNLYMINWLVNDIFHIIPAIIHWPILVIDCVKGWYGCFRMTSGPIWKRICSNKHVINIFKIWSFQYSSSYHILTCIDLRLRFVQYGHLRLIINPLWKIRSPLNKCVLVLSCYFGASLILLYNILYLQNVMAGKRYCFSQLLH